MKRIKNIAAANFGMLLRSMRQHCRLTREQLAKRVGISPARLARLERGEQCPDERTRMKLEQVFGCTLYLRPHKQVTVEVGKNKEDIDEGIAPLIREMWVAGIDTVMSCQQDGHGSVWIEFEDLEDIMAFFTIVARYEPGPDTLYNRMNPVFVDKGPLPSWDVELFIQDLGAWACEHDPGMNGQYEPAFYFALSLRFPPQDLPTVLKRLKAHNRRRRRLQAAMPSPMNQHAGGADPIAAEAPAAVVGRSRACGTPPEDEHPKDDGAPDAVVDHTI
jgi:transcriptional regulator with XRE-family HTH domain